MSIVLSPRLWAWECHVNFSSLESLLSGIMVFSVLVMSLWRPCVPPSPTWSQVSGGGWAMRRLQMSLLTHALLSDGLFLKPWALCPYLSPQEERLLGIPYSKITGVDIAVSVSRKIEYLACAWAQEMPTNDSSNPADQGIHQTLLMQFKGLLTSPELSDLRPKKIPELTRPQGTLPTGVISSRLLK